MEPLDLNKQPSFDLKQLGTEALKYVRERLREAGPLSSKVAEKQIVRVASALEADEESKSANDFESGGTGADRLAWVSIIDVLNNGQNPLVIADGWLFDVSDSHLGEKQYFSTASGSVYFFSSSAFPVPLDTLIKWASPYPSVVLISPDIPGILPGAVLNEPQLNELAEKVSSALVGVHDEETYWLVMFE